MHEKEVSSNHNEPKLTPADDTSGINDVTHAAAQTQKQAPPFTHALLSSITGLLITLGVALSIVMIWQNTSSTEEAIRQEISETLNQVTGRLQTLIKATEMTAESVERIIRTTHVTGTELQFILENSLAAFEQRPELSFIGIVLPETGEYGNLERTATGEIILWLFPGDRSIDPNIRNFILTDRGFVLRQDYPTDGYDPRNRPFYQTALNSQDSGTWMQTYPWITHIPDSEPLWGFSYVKALYDDTGKLLSVIDVDFDMPALNNFLTTLSREYQSQLHVIELGSSPLLIGGFDVHQEPLSLTAEFSPLTRFSKDIFVERMPLEKEYRWVAARQLKLKGGISWLIVTSRTAPFIEAPLRRQLFQILCMGIVIAFGMLLVAFRMARRFGKPLAALEQRVASIGQDDSALSAVKTWPSINSFRETQRLGKALDRMAIAVHQQVLAKEQQVASLALKGAIFDFTSAAIFSLDQQLIIIEWNAAAERLFGKSQAQVTGHIVSDIIFAPDGPANWDTILHTTGLGIFQFIGVHGTFDAELHFVTFTQEGRKIHTLILNDISARKRIEQQLRQERDYADAVLNSLPGVFYHYDENMRLIRWNKNLERISGYTPAELYGVNPEVFFTHNEKTAVLKRIGEVFEKGECAVETDYLLKDGRQIPYLFTGVRFQYNGEQGFVGVGYDITERKQAEERIRYLALYDSITNLPNRHLILERIEQSINQAETGHLLALLYINLDRFKVVNDGYGHLFGDTVLKAVGEFLLKLVDERSTVAHLNGDEFLILVTKLTAPAEVKMLACTIIESFNIPITVQERDIHLSGSIGISLFPQNGESPDTLIDKANMAMYRAKELGRNTYQFFTHEMEQEIRHKVDLEIKLRGAAVAGQLQLLYQPKVDLKTGHICGCEALLRWNQPDLGIISPSHFIPIAEDSGLIVPIGDWALRKACNQAKIWMDAGLPPITVAVNISVRQFLQQDVVAWVERTLLETGLPPTWLELELTESLIAQDIKKVTSTISRLKGIGVKFSIDDFGTGYSNLNYLKHFHVDTLKIDQSFVYNMLAEKEKETIVLTFIALAHNLKSNIIAEGVETAEHCNFLRANGCDEIQGYYFSKPVSAEEFGIMLRDRKKLP